MQHSIIDSHCHLDRLDLDRLEGTLEDVLIRAGEQGVSHMLCVSITLEDFPQVLALAHRYPYVFASVGVHPNEPDCHEPDVAELVRLADDPKIIAIGETGLDYFRSEGDPEWQRQRFRQHIRASLETGKPLIIHTRDAEQDTLKIMKEEQAGRARGVMHCFTGSQAMAETALELGFYISFSGIVTFNNANDLREIAAKIPCDRLLIETDSPYLTPAPFRGKPNQPGNTRLVAECLAELRGESVDDIARHTTLNFYKLFGQPKISTN
jgi:TatD DNase family protein